ncbi:MAG: 3'-5' exonuclease [Anaerolineales bacterium]|nr:3'-5' exonuclease [Anaerolineales bacterium]
MSLEEKQEIYVSVDVETAGPNPSHYALLAIGACLVDDPELSFYVEIQPTSLEVTEEALAVSRLSLEELVETGAPPMDAMLQFETWLKTKIPRNGRPVFVGFNAPFDWMFVNDYFHRFLGHNPFGHTALDIKAFFMGLTGSSWSETTYHRISSHTWEAHALSHQALHDAQDQARIFKQLLYESRV